MKHGGGNRYGLMIGIVILLFCSSQTVRAQDEPNPDLASINQSISDKKSNISVINQQIDDYQKKISEKESEKASLTNQLDLLQNRIGKTQAEIDQANLEMDVVRSEIDATEKELLVIQTQLEQQRVNIMNVLERIQTEDARIPLQTFYTSKSFSEFFDAVEQLHQVNADLKKNVDETKRLKQQEDEKHTQQLAKQTQLTDLQKTLEADKIQLTEEAESNQLLVENAQSSESKFQKLLKDLKQEQTFVQDQVQELQSQLEKKIKPTDAINGGLLSWPVDPHVRGINVLFHDPTYPFRNLFEHSGIDLPAAMGTPVHSAAAGYVAWTRKGTQYGNYIMVIHTDGIATLYAHLSRIDVVPDQFVQRGEQIGAVGMTGFATGPHLHFEVRKEGIPTDPLPFLPSI